MTDGTRRADADAQAASPGLDAAAALTVREALALPTLKDCRVVAGAAGLDRVVRWVHVIDIPEITKWVRGGEILLTTGWGWPKNPVEIRRILRELNAIQLAAVFFAVGNYWPSVPREVIRQAEELSLPIVEVPWELPFVDITEAVDRAIIERQYRAIEHANHIHKVLAETALRADSLADLVGTLARLIGQHAAVYSTDGRAIACAGDRDVMDAIVRQLAGRWPASLTCVEGPGGNGAGAICPIMSGSETLGQLVVAGPSPLSELELRGIGHAATIMALHILRQRSLMEVEARVGYTFVDALLRGGIDPALLERGRLLGFQPTDAYRVVSFHLWQRDRGPVWPLQTAQDFEMRQSLAQVVSDVLRLAGRPVLTTFSMNRVIALLPGERDAAERLVAAVSARWQGGLLVSVGMEHVGPGGVAQGGREAEWAAQGATGPGVRFYDDQLLDQVLRALPSDPRVAAVVERIHGPFARDRSGPVLWATLKAYLANGRSASATAKALDIHRNTLRHRLTRIRKLVGIPLTDPELPALVAFVDRYLQISHDGPASSVDRAFRT